MKIREDTHVDKIEKERYRTAIGTHINIGGLAVHLTAGDVIQVERITRIPHPTTRDYEKIDYKCQSCHCTRGSNKENCHDCCVYNRLFPPTNHQPNDIKNIYTSYLKDYGKGYNEQTFLQYVACSLFNDHERQEAIVALRQAAVNLEQNEVKQTSTPRIIDCENCGKDLEAPTPGYSKNCWNCGHTIDSHERMALESGSPHTCYTCGCLPCTCNQPAK